MGAGGPKKARLQSGFVGQQALQRNGNGLEEKAEGGGRKELGNNGSTPRGVVPRSDIFRGPIK